MKTIRPIFIWYSAALFFLFLAQITYTGEVKAQDKPGQTVKTVTPMQGDHQEAEGHEHHHHMTGSEHWMAPEKDAKKTNPVQPTEVSVARGRELFKQKCAPCHGESAKGNGRLAETLAPRPSDLTSDMASMHPDGDLFYKISKGRGAMPAWESVFSEEDRWNLVNFIRFLGKTHEAGGNKNKN
ncbi:MAG: cytochrome c [bacterium]